MVRTVTPREQLADMLQRSRTEAGYGLQGALAKHMNVSRAVVSKAENPSEPVPSDPILAAWAGATGAPLEVLADLAQRARSGVPDWFVSWRQAEADAQILRYWSPVVVPGIVQTAGYMRAVFADEGHLLDQVDDLVAARLERQATAAGNASKLRALTAFSCATARIRPDPYSASQRKPGRCSPPH